MMNAKTTAKTKKTLVRQLDIFGTRTAAPQPKHSKNCDARHTAKLAYDAKYPNACRKCQGYGFHTAPATREDPGLHEFCECLADGRCPRCGHQHNENWNLYLDDVEPVADYCEACGWDPESGDRRPDDDCNCFETPDCPHPPAKIYSWYARDDTAPTGKHLCVACQCGAVLR